jgi:PAS domain S-box-containing protein
MEKHQTIKILLIEDNPADARLLSEMIDDVEQVHMSVKHADCLSEGLENLIKEKFDVLLLDIGLPDSSGLESIEEIGASAPEMPVIMLTGIQDEETISSALQMGAQDYLVKGQIDSELLVRAIRYAIERKRAYQAIESSQHFIERIAETSPNILYVFDIIDHNLVYANEQLKTLLGYSLEEIQKMGRSVYERIIHEDDLEKSRTFINQLSKTGDGEIYDLIIRIKHIKGEWRWFFIKSVVFNRTVDGLTRQILGTIEDITNRKKAEEQIVYALREKELLLQEIHHRVKNNMMVITSLLQLQARQIKDKENKNIFNDSVNRIKTMALIHEKLYGSGDMSNIKFDKYLDGLINNVLFTYGAGGRKISLHKELDDVPLAINSAIPCGLIVNELLTNCLKHAFPDEREGKIRVSLRELQDSEIRNGDLNPNSKIELVVSDNGIGMPDKIELGNSGSLGMPLIEALVKQLRGTMVISNENGTEVRIGFRK